MKGISCGLLIKCKNKYLLVKSSNGHIWGIPKGVKKKKETYLEAAVRETEEETGLDFSFLKDIKPDLQYRTKNKKFVVFKICMDKSEFLVDFIRLR